MKKVFGLVACASLCALLFVAHQQNAQAAATAMTDQEFMDFAAQTDMMEAHLGQLAASQASAQAIKDYAQTMVTDHTQDYTQLGTLAAKANLVVPKGLDAQHTKMGAPFEKLNGKAFDARYAQEMIAGHTKAIAVYTKESESATNADVKAYAAQTLPTLHKHLDAAKDLKKAKS